MDSRIVDFIAALRASGVRVSVAESADALRAIESTGITRKDVFRQALQATLVKEARDIPTFQELFPTYFGGDAQLPNTPGAGMSPEEQEEYMRQLEEMLANMTPDQLRELFEAMMQGQNLSRDQLREMAREAIQGMPMPLSGRSPQQWAIRRALRQLEFERLQEFMQELFEKLREAGISEEALRQLMREARENQRALEEELAAEIGRQLQQQANDPQRIDQLLDRPFEDLRPEDIGDLRSTINRLAAALRSRAALRQRRANKGTIDAKHTIRANLRYHGVPIDVRLKRKHLKPKLVVLVDRSRSTENVVRFLLLLIYALKDQVSRTRSFAYIDTIHDISPYFEEHRPELAIDQVMQNVYPHRSYSTDLGNSMKDFLDAHGGTVDRRTTVIILGDGRNNENDPGIAYLSSIRARAKRVVWFNPEPPHMWGRYDPGSLSSDMLAYQPLCHAVHHVSNLRQLVAAVDSLFEIH